MLYATYYLGGFAASLSFTYLISAVGMHWTLWFFAAVNILIVLVDFLDLPETRGRSLQEIMEEREALKQTQQQLQQILQQHQLMQQQQMQQHGGRRGTVVSHSHEN